MIIPKLKILSRSIVGYNEYVSDGRFSRSIRQHQSAEKLLTEKTYTGILCPGAKKRLTKCLELLIQYAKPKTVMHEGRPVKFSANFITLTIYNYGKFVTGREAHEHLLEPFLKWMRDLDRKQREAAGDDERMMYIWKAELQGKRKDCQQLHYHITTDTYFHKDVIRDKWNELQIKAGYLDMVSYKKQFGHTVVPSTKIHALYRKRDPVRYVCKEIMNYSDALERKYEQIKEAVNARYFANEDDRASVLNEMTKDIQNKFTVGGKVWDCSINLKQGKPHTYECSQWAADDVAEQNLQKEVAAGNVVKVATDHCTIYKFKKGHTWAILPRQQRHEYWRNGVEVRSFKRMPPTKEPKKEIELPPKIPDPVFKPVFYKKFDLFNPN